MSVQLLAGFAILALGVGLLGWAVEHARQSVMFRLRGTRVAGTVVRHVPAPGDSDGPETFFLEVAFNYRGRHTCRSGWSSSHPRPVGRAIGVLVPHNRPREAQVHAFAEWWMSAIFLPCLGLAVSGMAALLLVGRS